MNVYEPYIFTDNWLGGWVKISVDLDSQNGTSFLAFKTVAFQPFEYDCDYRLWNPKGLIMDEIVGSDFLTYQNKMEGIRFILKGHYLHEKEARRLWSNLVDLGFERDYNYDI